MAPTLTNAIRSFLLLALLSTPGWGQGSRADSATQISITSNGAGLRVQISATVPLIEVLKELCTQQNVHCAGTESLAAFAVPDVTIEGTFSQVTEILLEGTDMNYSLSRGAPGDLATLVILGRAATGTQDNAVAAAGQEPQAGATALSAKLRLEVSERSEVPEPESPEDVARTESMMRQMFGGDSQSVASNSDHGATAAGNSSATEGTVPQYLPFPDQFGNPVPITATAASASFQPFPDRHGNPIPTASKALQGSPFPPPPSH